MIFLESIIWLSDYYYLLLIGIKNTILIWFFSAIISLLIGFFWGILREKKIVPEKITFMANGCAYLFQGVPFYLQLLVSYFIIGPFLHIQNATIISIFALGICSAAYTSQIIQTAINTIPEEQWLLARSLGYSTYQIVYYVICPQIIDYVIPLFINECDQLIKSISILSTIGVLELTKSGLNIINITFKPIPVYFLLCIIYLSCSLLLRYAAYQYKKKLTSKE